MKPTGTWNGIKYYCFIKTYSFNDFCELIDAGPVESYKLSLIGKNGYKIEVRPHASNRINDNGLCEVSSKKILIYIPEKLDKTETYVLFGSGTEIEFSEEQLGLALATELSNALDYIWSHSMPIETYVEYLNKTIIWP